MKDIKVRVGETIKFEVKIGGEPPPEVTWFHKDKALKSDGKRVKLNTEKTKATIKIENAERADTGKMTLHLKNTSGEESASANVLVVGKCPFEHL